MDQKLTPNALQNDKLEELMGKFKTKMTQENYVKIMLELENSFIMQPALVPPGTTKEELAKMKAPLPMIIKSGDDKRFFPVFTSKKQIPENQKYQVMMMMKFPDCGKLSQKEGFQLDGIVINPFTDNIIVNKEAIQVMINKISGKDEVKIQLTLEDAIMQIELVKKFYEQPAAYMENLASGKEQFLQQEYKEIYERLTEKKALCPYQEDDFEIMVLNLSENTRMARIAVPAAKGRGITVCTYLFVNPETEEAVYYVIKKDRTAKVNMLSLIDEQGASQELGTAPEEGSEMFELMKRLPWA